MNMGPDRSNYEIWLIDYLEGTLDNERAGLLFAFLEENPDIKEEFADLAPISIKPAGIQFRNKEGLKKAPAEMSQHQFELLCVASSENDLENGQKAELEEILSLDPEKRKTFGLIQKIRLLPPADKFPNKYRLRKLTTGQRIFRYSLTLVSTAAAILVMILVLRKPEVVQPVPETVAVNGVTSPASEKYSRHTDQAKVQTIALNSVADVHKTKVVGDNHSVAGSGTKDPVVADIKRYDIAKVAYSEDGLKRSDAGTRLAEINITPVNTETDPGDHGPGQLLERLFREKMIKSKEAEKGSLKAFDIADAGVKGLKKLFGWNMSLEKNRDEKGEIKSVRFSSKLISFNAPVKKGTHLP
jgi:hypothetical protein